MKMLNALWLLLSLSLLCSCALVPGKDTGGLDMEAWCRRDSRMPWTGCWTEVARLDCDSGQEFEPESTIGEFRLASDGSYSVTWTPFEFFVDYAGPYTVDEQKGLLALTLGDRAPLEAQGQGRYSITEQGELVLEGIWLGVRHPEGTEQACGHRFRMRSAE